MDNKNNRISLIGENGKAIGIKFRGKTYLVENSNTDDTLKEIAKDHPDFIEIWKDASKNKNFKVIKGKKTKKGTAIITNTFKKRLAAGIGAVLVLGGAVTLTACKKNEKTSNREEVVIEEIEEEIDENEILEILKSLDEGLQQDSWNMINEFQNYFNNVAAENYAIDEDGESRLYLTAEQCIALFTRMNADRITPEDMAYIFGPNSTYFTFANLDDKFNEACRILNYYYLSAKETSGLDMLFIDESDKEVFKNFEELVLEYNRTLSEESKNKIVDSLNNIFLNESLSDPKTTNMGAASIIGTGIVPVLHATKVIDEELLNTLVEINETVTCDKLKKYVIDATSIESSEDYKNKELLEKLPSILDKLNIKNTNLDINFEARYFEILKNIYGEDYVFGKVNSDVLSYFENSTYSSSTTYSSTGTSISQSEAIKEFGSSAVKEAENKAQTEFNNTYEDENAKQEAYGKGLTAIANSSLYDSAYNFVAQNGYKPSVSNYSGIINSVKNSYSGSYSSSFNSGVDAGASSTINNAYNDAIAEYNYRQSLSSGSTSSSTTEKEEYIEEPIATETPVTPVPTVEPTPEVVITPEPTVAPTPVPTTAPTPVPAPVVTPTPAPVVTPEPEPVYVYEETITEEYIPEEELVEEAAYYGEGLVRVRG